MSLITSIDHDHTDIYKTEAEYFEAFADFELFYRSDSVRTRAENSGYGLGLAIAKSLVEKNDFEIKVESELGKGSKFKLIV